ncbi:hypothetical protein [Dyadobacter sp. BHUBP1]|uniref:hypothetical protein n=1 Tax=Dyadobacter sp. BHUBP1 TaxID=3424178 RepID=UPI003D33A657
MITVQKRERSLAIKDRLLARFVIARNHIGKSWRQSLARTHHFYGTHEGQAYLVSVVQAVSDKSRGHVDRIERVTLDLEEIVGIKSGPEVPGQKDLLIKERLLHRFVIARKSLGRNWRQFLAMHDPFFYTKRGVDMMTSVCQAVTARKKSRVDKIEQVTLAMEKVIDANLQQITKNAS